MKKGAAKLVEVEPVEVVPEVPQFGFGRFEYKDNTLYVGNWKILKGFKVKHGHGKITFPGAQGAKGIEEYEGDWVDDKMQGHGRYVYASGATYIGEWKAGMMHGKGKKVNPDGTSYEGEWENNLMHGDGTYVDSNKSVWNGLFIEGGYDSKIQKKLRDEKVVLDKIKEYKSKAVRFFTMFAEQFAKSDKKTFKDNLTPMFASADTCSEFVGEPYSKYDERAPDKWNDLIKAVYNEGKVNIHVLKTKENATVLKSDLIHAEQLRQKKGGQIVEIEGQVADKNYMMALCELANENWVLVYCGERVQS